ncbi:MAG TPA: hypothetical protein VEA60_12775 [Allosphingosinicella sp.]|nr:hypothetical protein [Allosphingosinicella sp.]
MDGTGDGRGGAGESGGGPYPNPHRRKAAAKDGFLGSGGQTEKAYHGHGRLGEEETADNPNAPAR